jgi:hypothetical protein
VIRFRQFEVEFGTSIRQQSRSRHRSIQDQDSSSLRVESRRQEVLTGHRKPSRKQAEWRGIGVGMGRLKGDGRDVEGYWGRFE